MAGPGIYCATLEGMEGLRLWHNLMRMESNDKEGGWPEPEM